MTDQNRTRRYQVGAGAGAGGGGGGSGYGRNASLGRSPSMVSDHSKQGSVKSSGYGQ